MFDLFIYHVSVCRRRCQLTMRCETASCGLSFSIYGRILVQNFGEKCDFRSSAPLLRGIENSNSIYKYRFTKRLSELLSLFIKRDRLAKIIFLGQNSLNKVDKPLIKITLLISSYLKSKIRDLNREKK